MDNEQIIIESEDQARDLIEEAYFAFTDSVYKKKYGLISENEKRLSERVESEIIDLDEKVDGQDFTFREFIDVYNDSESNAEAAGRLKVQVDAKGGQDMRNSMATKTRRIAARIKRLDPNIELDLKKPQPSSGSDGGKRGGPTVYPGSGREVSKFRNNKTALFQGEIYTDQTQIEPQRWRIFGKKTPVKQNVAWPFFKKYSKIFLLGYELTSSPDVFYELWFDTLTSTFEIHDKHGEQIGRSHRSMNHAVDAFTDLVGDFGDSDLGRKDAGAQDELEDAVGDGAKINMKMAARQAQRESVEHADDFQSLVENEEEEEIQAILERTVNTRGMLAQMLRDDLLEEYEVSRMNRRIAKSKFWEVFGRKPEFPSKYLNRGAKNNALKIFGKGRQATFIRGFSFIEDRINIEVWLIKEGKRGNATFWVFNLTTGEIIARDLNRVRDAYRKVGELIAAKTD